MARDMGERDIQVTVKRGRVPTNGEISKRCEWQEIMSISKRMCAGGSWFVNRILMSLQLDNVVRGGMWKWREGSGSVG